MGKAIFQTCLNLYSFYITFCKDITMESWYLKSIFKNKKSTVSM